MRRDGIRNADRLLGGLGREPGDGGGEGPHDGARRSP